jgi:hypothetical protein
MLRSMSSLGAEAAAADDVPHAELAGGDMYHVSRALYRELVPLVVPCHGQPLSEARVGLLRACEASVDRLATEPRCARPAQRLFMDVRHLFPLSNQRLVYVVCDRQTRLAAQLLDARVRSGSGPVRCHATTRRGAPCMRAAMPNSRYCASHRCVDEDGALDDGCSA